MSFPTLLQLNGEKDNETVNKEKRLAQTMIHAMQKIKQDAMIMSDSGEVMVTVEG